MTFSFRMSWDVYAQPPTSKPQLLNLTYRRLNSLPFSRVHCTLCREAGVVVVGRGVHSGGPLSLLSLICILLTSAAPSQWPCEPPTTFSLFVFACLHVVCHLTLHPSAHPSLGSSVFLADALNFQAFQPCSDSAAWLHN